MGGTLSGVGVVVGLGFVGAGVFTATSAGAGEFPKVFVGYLGFPSSFALAWPASSRAGSLIGFTSGDEGVDEVPLG